MLTYFDEFYVKATYQQFKKHYSISRFLQYSMSLWFKFERFINTPVFTKYFASEEKNSIISTLWQFSLRIFWKKKIKSTFWYINACTDLISRKKKSSGSKVSTLSRCSSHQSFSKISWNQRFSLNLDSRSCNICFHEIFFKSE